MLNAFLVPLLRERPVNLIDVWDPGEVLRLMREEGLGVSGGATYFLTSLLDHPDFTDEHLALMPFAGLGGSAVPVAVIERLTALGMKAFRSYGSTEHPSITGCLLDDPEEKRLTTDGRALPGVEVRLDDDGQILSRGPDCFVGYIDPELTARPSTRTAGTTPATSACSTTTATSPSPTASPTSSSGAARTSSAVEIEELLMGLDAVAEVCVVAAPDERLGRARGGRRARARRHGRADHRGGPRPPGGGRPGPPEVARVDLRGRGPAPDAVGQGPEVPAPPAAPGGPSTEPRIPPLPPRPGRRRCRTPWPRSGRRTPAHPSAPGPGRPKGLNALGTLAQHPS